LEKLNVTLRETTHRPSAHDVQAGPLVIHCNRRAIAPEEPIVLCQLGAALAAKIYQLAPIARNPDKRSLAVSVSVCFD